MSRGWRLLAASLLLGCCALVGLHIALQRLLDQPLLLAQPQVVEIARGAHLQGVLNQWQQQGWLKPSPLLRLLRFWQPELSQIRAGVYELPANSTLIAALAILRSGQEIQLKFTLVEGSRFIDVLQQLKTLPYLTLKLGSDPREAAAMLDPGLNNAEGWLYPDTYHYTPGTTDVALLQRAYRQMQTQLELLWQQRQPELPLKSPYQALILASIIEKETGYAPERKRIASVFINRLNKGMRLQTDPTVIYGMGADFDGDIRRKDLRTHTPYNTYMINGLTPTPIAMPSADSIAAALDPEHSQYLYFVASGGGKHHFSKTLSEHNAAVRKYILKR